MPKLKTHKSTAKRVRKTSSGKLMHDRAFTHHKLQAKSGSRKRRLSIDKTVHGSDHSNISRVITK